MEISEPKRFGLFLFDEPPWADNPLERLFIGSTKWILDTFHLPSSTHIGAVAVTIKWPKEAFDNYLKADRVIYDENLLITRNANMLFSSHDDRDLRQRKQYFEKNGTVNSPEHVSRRINAARKIYDDDFDYRHSNRQRQRNSQAAESQHDPSSAIGCASSAAGDDEISGVEGIEIGEEQRQDLESINMLAMDLGQDPITESPVIRPKAKKRKRPVSSSSESSVQEEDEIDTAVLNSEDDENSPSKLRFKVKLAKSRNEVNNLRNSFNTEEKKLLADKIRLMEKVINLQEAQSQEQNNAEKTVKDKPEKSSARKPKEKVKVASKPNKRIGLQYERLLTPQAIQKDDAGANYVLGRDVLLPVERLNRIIVTKDSGRFICALMSELLLEEEMTTMSLHGGTCAANKGTIIVKTAIPGNIRDAIIETTLKKYNVSREDILLKIGTKLSNVTRKNRV